MINILNDYLISNDTQIVLLGLSLTGHWEMVAGLQLAAFHVLTIDLIVALLKDRKLFVKVSRDNIMFVSRAKSRIKLDYPLLICVKSF